MPIGYISKVDLPANRKVESSSGMNDVLIRSLHARCRERCPISHTISVNSDPGSSLAYPSIA
jgi:hypothetical protein